MTGLVNPAGADGRPPGGDEAVLERFPAVRLDHRNKWYYAGLLRRELLMNRCRTCGTWHGLLRPICPACWSSDVVPAPVSGRGTVHLLTVLHQGPPAAGVDYAGGFPLAAIELAEQPGLRVTATVVDCPRDRLRIGLPVTLTWTERDGAPWPAFRPASRPAGASDDGPSDDGPAMPGHPMGQP